MKGFTVGRWADGEYGHLELRIYLRVPESIAWSYDATAEVSWQCGGQGLENKWYAYTVKVEGKDLARMAEVLRELRRVLPERGEPGPEEVVELLKKRGFRQVAYHRGLHRYLPVDEWPEGDVYEARSSEGTVGATVAPNEREARGKLLTEAASKIVANDWESRYWARWLEEGAPVVFSQPGHELRLPSLLPGVRDPEAA